MSIFVFVVCVCVRLLVFVYVCTCVCLFLCAFMLEFILISCGWTSESPSLAVFSWGKKPQQNTKETASALAPRWQSAVRLVCTVCA